MSRSMSMSIILFSYIRPPLLNPFSCSNLAFSICMPDSTCDLLDGGAYSFFNPPPFFDSS